MIIVLAPFPRVHHGLKLRLRSRSLGVKPKTRVMLMLMDLPVCPGRPKASARSMSAGVSGIRTWARSSPSSSQDRLQI